MAFLVALGPPKIDALRRRWKADSGFAAGKIVASADGMAVLADRRLGTRWSADRSCLLLGDLFSAGSGTPAPPVLPGLARPADLGPFLSRYWGSYILFCRFGPGRHAALRDPSGALPLYRTIVDGVHCYLDNAAEAAALGISGDSIDTDFLRHWLAFPFLRTARTGHASVEEILPGEMECVEAGRSVRTALWTPRPFIDKARQVGHFGEAARLLRGRLIDTVPAIAAASRPFALQLSGGLDSSIICAVLGAAGIPFDAINYFTPSPDGDERRFARAAADAAGAPLTECAARPADDIDPVLPRSFRPLPNLALRPLFRTLDEVSRERGACALVDGTGGDNLQGSHASAPCQAPVKLKVKGAKRKSKIGPSSTNKPPGAARLVDDDTRCAI